MLSVKCCAFDQQSSFTLHTPWHESHMCHQQTLNLMTFSLFFSFVHYFIFFLLDGAPLDALDMKPQACFLNTPQRTELMFSSRVSFSGKRKREEQKKSKQRLPQPLLPNISVRNRGKATGVAVRGHTAAVASAQPSKPLLGMRSARCFPSETVRCVHKGESAGGVLLSFPNACLPAGFSFPTLPLTIAVFLWMAFKQPFQSLQDCYASS